MNKTFTKDNLKTGHIVVTTSGTNAILLGNRFKCANQLLVASGYAHLDFFNEDLEDAFGSEPEININEVYEIVDMYDYSLETVIKDLPKDAVKCIWKRDRVIDWSKVPKFTRVHVRDYENDDWENAYFIGCNEGSDYKYRATSRDKFTYVHNHGVWWKYIEIFDEDDIKEEWYK